MDGWQEVEEMSEREAVRLSELSGGEHRGNVIQSPVTSCCSCIALDRPASLTGHNVIVCFHNSISLSSLGDGCSGTNSPIKAVHTVSGLLVLTI